MDSEKLNFSTTSGTIKCKCCKKLNSDILCLNCGIKYHNEERCTMCDKITKQYCSYNQLCIKCDKLVSDFEKEFE